jgi:hypothetical protein
MKNGKTTNPVHDLAIHPREQELIVGTHGRGIFIADISGLQALTPAALEADAHVLAPIVPAVQYTARAAPRGRVAELQRREPAAGRAHQLLPEVGGQGRAVRVYDGARLIAELARRATPASTPCAGRCSRRASGRRRNSSLPAAAGVAAGSASAAAAARRRPRRSSPAAAQNTGAGDGAAG